MNAFDLVITVALGSTFATVLLGATVPFAEGILALALLICLQYAITWLSARSVGFQNPIKSEPTLLVHESRYLEVALRQQRVTGRIADAAEEFSIAAAAFDQPAIFALPMDQPAL